MRLTHAEIFERQRFRRDDPIWQLITAVSTWASWSYADQPVSQEKIDRCWAAVEEKERALRELITKPDQVGEPG